LDAYFDAATDVSRRLIADETGERVVEAIAAMQAKQARFGAVLDRSTEIDRVGLASAFDAVFRADQAAQRYRFWIVVACTVAVAGISGWLSRNVLRSVSDIEAGFRRFGAGEFTQTIPLTTDDEIGDLARHANEMAASLDRQIAARTEVEKALLLSNQELEAFSYSVAHDLRAPLRGISGFSTALLEDFGDKLDDDAKGYLNRITAAAERMSVLIDALLSLSRVTRGELRREELDLSRMAEAVVQRLRASDPSRDVEFVAAEGLGAWGDSGLLSAVFENLLSNAWKFTGAKAHARITFGVERKGGTPVYFVKDDGAGFSMAHANKLFAPFQRLHSSDRFAGTGIGLATVQRIILRHGGRIWAESEEEKGATFYFTIAERGTRPPS
ncbi:MAG: sensor histidine kinase, partial [Polyangiaceae bacterium]